MLRGRAIDLRSPSTPTNRAASLVTLNMVFDSLTLLPVASLMIDGFAQYAWIYFKMQSKRLAATICFVRDASLRQLSALYATKE